jgi:hypothetical protein
MDSENDTECGFNRFIAERCGNFIVRLI